MAGSVLDLKAKQTVIMLLGFMLYDLLRAVMQSLFLREKQILTNSYFTTYSYGRENTRNADFRCWLEHLCCLVTL